MAKTTLKAIFITHPHEDHHDLVSELLSSSDGLTINENTLIFLGGLASYYDYALTTKALGKTHQYYIASENTIAHYLPNETSRTEEDLETLKTTLKNPLNPSYGLEIKYPKETEGLEGLSW